MMSGSGQSGLNACSEEVLDSIKDDGSVIDSINPGSEKLLRELSCKTLKELAKYRSWILKTHLEISRTHIAGPPWLSGMQA